MTQAAQHEEKTGYTISTTPHGVVVLPYANKPDIVLEIRPKGKTRHTVTLQLKHGELKEIVFLDSGDLGSEKFREKLSEKADVALKDTEVEEEFSSRLKRIAADVPKHFEDRYEDAKKDKERRSGDRLAGTPYVAGRRGFKRVIPREEGDDKDIPLTNWLAEIVKDTVTDDGAETTRSFTIEANFNGRTQVFEVPASEYESMRWVVQQLGPKAVCFPNQKEHARVCMQLYSPETETERVYAHTGWRQIAGVWCYLHAEGAIAEPVGSLSDASGQSFGDGGQSSAHADPDKQAENSFVGNVGSLLQGEGVRLTGKHALRRLHLPADEEKERKAIQWSLAILRLGPYRVTAPILASVGRAPLGDTDFTVFYVGKTGAGKTALCVLAQQHFGAGMDEKKVLSWESTANSLEIELHAIKDQVAIVDDYVPQGTGRQRTIMQRNAERILREKGNQNSRGRLYSDLTQRAERPPRAFIIATGEEIPPGQSLRSRMFVVHMTKPDGVPEIDFEKLTALQEAARKGYLATAMGGYVRWLAPRYDTLRDELREKHHKLRKLVADFSSADHHKRTAGVVADLALGLWYYLRYAVERGAVGEVEAEQLWSDASHALLEESAEQAKHQADAEPTQRFASLLASALGSGAANIKDPESATGVPLDMESGTPNVFGWTMDEGADTWRPRGETIGYIHEEKIYLDPDAALKVAIRVSADSSEPFSRTKQAMSSDLVDGKHILESDGKRGATRRKHFSRVGRKPYWVLSSEFLWGVSSTKTAHTAHEEESPIDKPQNRGQWPTFDEV